MDTPRKLIVGYDLCEDFTQISCYSYKTFEPIPICQGEEEEYNPIPTALCVKKETKLWVYGDEAIACASNGEGVLVDQLLAKIKLGEEIEILGQKFNGILLLEKFIKKSLMLVKNYFPTEPITKIVVTIRGTEPILVAGIYEALASIGLEKDRAVVISHASAFIYYALSQDKALWMNDVGLFDFDEHSLSYYQISINRRIQPSIAGLKKKDFTDTLNYSMLKQKRANASYAFENIAKTVLYKQIITTIYFTGKGFEGGWANEAIKSLCAGRRVFIGQNLYTKGACYAAKELSGDKKLENYILLNDEMTTCAVWLRVYKDAKIKEERLAEAAIPWYEINRSIEVIPEGEAVIEVLLRNIMTKETVRERLIPDHFPSRPNRMTRLEINLTCTNNSTFNITVKDLGFGDSYPETGQVWEFILKV